MTTRWLDRGRKLLPYAVAVAWRLVAVVLALEVVYLIVANVVLKTSLLKDFAARGDDLRVDYASAYSVLPGRIEVEDLEVRFHDRNVEFSISVERGTLDVSLHELAARRFHALRVDGRSVSYRMRHKVLSVGKNGPRLAAYPPIPGFADPPLYAKGEDQPAPPIPDEEYDLWEVKVDDVRAEVSEVWILEHRYQGPGLATGAFRIKPARYYEVNGTRLALDGGTLKLGEALVAREVRLSIDCTVTGSDPRKLRGLEPLRHVFAGVRGQLEGTDLSFLDAYLAPRLAAGARGSARADIDVRVEQGVLAPGSRVELTSSGAKVETAAVKVAGPLRLGLFRAAKPPGPRSPFEVVARSPRLDVDLPGGATVRLENVELGAALTPDLTQPIGLVRATLAPVKLSVADLGALRRSLPNARKLPELRGRAEGTLRASKEGREPIQGSFRLALRDATLATQGSRSLPWNATVESEDVTVAFRSDPAVAGSVVLHVDRASALLPLVSSSSVVRDLGERVLELGALHARLEVAVAERRRVDLVEARTGILKARGWVEERKGGAHGRVLVATPAANVGISIDPAGTETELLVPDDWLEAKARARGGQPRTERGSLPRSPAKPRGNTTK